MMFQCLGGENNIHKCALLAILIMSFLVGLQAGFSLQEEVYEEKLMVLTPSFILVPSPRSLHQLGF